MSQFSQSILNTLQSREFYRVTPPPPKPTHSTMPASQPAGRPWSNSSATGSQTSPTYFEEVPVKVPRNPPLVRVVPCNAAATAQFEAIAREVKSQVHSMAIAQQTSHAAKLPFHPFRPFHPDVTVAQVQQAKFSDHVSDILKGKGEWPNGTLEQNTSSSAFRNAGFTLGPDSYKLAAAIKDGLRHGSDWKRDEDKSKVQRYTGFIPFRALVAPFDRYLHVTVTYSPDKRYVRINHVYPRW